MDFLRELSFSDDVISKIELENDKALVFNFMCASQNAKMNIEYLRSIGVEVVELLLIYRLELFLIEHVKLKEAVESYEVSVLAKLINEDINAVNLL